MKAIGKCLALSCIVFLAGCQTPEIRRTSQHITNDDTSTSADLAKLQATPEAYYSESNELWLGNRKVDPARQAQPEFLKTPITYSHQYPVTLSMLAEYLSTAFGIQVAVTLDGLQAAADAAYDPLQALARQQGETPTASSAPQANGSAGVNVAAGAFVLQYEGSVRGLLDQATARTSTAWKLMPDNRIVIYGIDTRTYSLHTLPGSSTINSSISNSATAGGASGGGGGGGGSGGGGTTTQQTTTSGQTTTVSTQIESVKAAADVVKTMLSPKGKVALSESSSALTVTDTPVVLDRVQQFVDQLNKRLTRQVVVDVRVYEVLLKRSENYGIDWELVWRNMAGNYKITTGSVPNVNENAAQLNFSVINPNMTYGGSSVLVNALSEQGNVSIKTSAAVSTLSGQPTPVQVAQQTTYVASVQSTLVSNAGTQSSITPGSVTTGFTMNLVPLVMDNNEIILGLQINLSTLEELRKIGLGANQIEAPTVNSRQFMQQVKLQSGSTVVLSGFEQDSLNTDSRGVGKPGFSLAGGSQSSTNSHTVIVVALTPRVAG